MEFKYGNEWTDDLITELDSIMISLRCAQKLEDQGDCGAALAKFSDVSKHLRGAYYEFKHYDKM